MKQIVYFVIIWISFSVANCQTIDWHWANGYGSTYGDECRIVKTDHNDNVYIAGSFGSNSIQIGGSNLVNTYSNNGALSDIYLAKFNANNQCLWVKKWGGSCSDAIYDIDIDVNNDVLMCGYYSSSDVSFISGNYLNHAGVEGWNDGFIAKIDGDTGNCTWVKTATGNSTNVASCITTDTQGNVFVGFFGDCPTLLGEGVNQTTVSGPEEWDFVIAKYNPNGVFQNYTQNTVGNGYDLIDDIITDDTGAVYCSVHYGSTNLTLPHSPSDITLSCGVENNPNVFVGKLDNDLNWLWAKQATGSSSSIEECGLSSLAVDAGYLYFTFDSNSYSGLSFGTYSTNSISAYHSIVLIRMDINGNNPIGTLLNTQTGPSDYFATVLPRIVMNNGYGYLVCDTKATISPGNTISSVDGNFEPFVAKFNSNLQWQWAKSCGGTGEQHVISIDSDNYGNLYLGGYFSTNMTFGVLPQLVIHGDTDIFFSQLGPEALPIVTFTPPAGSYTSAQSVTLSSSVSGTTFRYTTNGNDPTETSALYSSAIPVLMNTTITIKARAYKSGWNPGAITSASYAVAPMLVVANPSFSVPAGNYTSTQSISITCTTEGAEIRYTTDGSDPTVTSTLFGSNSPITINTGTDITLKSRAYKTGYTASQIITAYYHVISYNASTNLNHTYNYSGQQVTNYRMIGIPGNLNIALSSIMNGNYGEDWKAYWDNGGNADYLIPWTNSAVFNITPGRGFWLLSKSPISIQQNVNSVLLDSDLMCPIPLHSGWNIISNPFNQDINWSDVKTQNGITDNLWSYAGSYNSSGVLSPYEGYYLYNRNNLTNLKIPYIASKHTISNAPPALEIRITDLESGFFSQVRCGISDLASNELDQYDQYSPNGNFSAISLTIGNQKLSEEFRSSYNQEFNLFLGCDDSHSISCTVENSELYPSVYLWDKLTDTFIDLKANSIFNLNPYHKRYSLLIGDYDFVGEMQSHAIPVITVLEQNSPNPFNDLTFIRCKIISQSQLSLKIFNCKGQLIKTLADKVKKEAGTHEWEFNGRDLASGIYFYQLSWRTDNDHNVITNKMLHIK